MSRHHNNIAIATIAAAAASLVACGGNGGGTTADDGSTTFAAYAQKASVAAAGSPLPLTADEQAEVARRSRLWAASTLTTGGLLLPDNAMVLPPLYFARLQAVASAAAGDTLAELRQQTPMPTTAAAAAALMSGIARTVSAGTESRVSNEFMRAITAADQPATWATLDLRPLSNAALALEPNMRLTVTDQFNITVRWPQATPFDGVFAASNGTRVKAPMLRLAGSLRSVSDAGMSADVMSAPQGRWLVRITPTAAISTWTADELASAVARAVDLALGSATPAVDGSVVLPVVPEFRAAGIDDVRGMQSAQDPVRANLRALDGQGGTYAWLPTGNASLNIGPLGLSLFGYSTAYFIFSPSNTSGGGTSVQNVSFKPPVPCGATDLAPGYLALVNRVGGIDMLARYTSLKGDPCS